MAIGSDHAALAQVAYGQASNPIDAWRLHSRLTTIAEYSTDDEAKYQLPAVNLEGSNEASIMIGGGFWVYATWPRLEIVTTLTIGAAAGGIQRGADLDDVFHYKLVPQNSVHP